MRRAQHILGQLAEPAIATAQYNDRAGLFRGLLTQCGVNGTTSALGLSGQVVIVTGSGQGIGAAAARLFAQQGAKVVVTDLDAKKSAAVATEIETAGGDVVSVPGDITDAKFPAQLVRTTIERFGKINIIVNNAGYTWDGMAHKMTDDQWQAMLMVHLTAPFRLIRAAAPYMRDAGKAEIDRGSQPENRCIINISSTSGLHGNVGQLNYATAKMGIVGFTKTLAKEWGMFGVRCNAIAFGYVATRLTASKENGVFMQVGERKIPLGIPGDASRRDWSNVPLRRGGSAEEAAGSIVLLASPLASYITGHTLEVTGGVGI